MECRIKEIIEKYQLSPLLGEGGYYRFIEEFGNNSGMIYYLITKETFSSLHSLTEDEVWFFLEGDDAEQIIFKNDKEKSIITLNKDNRVSIVKKNTYQATRLKEGSKYAFFSTVMSPRYKDEMFSLPSKEMLEKNPELEKWSCL